MREMQMVTYPSLMNIPYPANALNFYNILIKFASIDVIGKWMETHVFVHFKFVETENFNQKFANYDYES